MSDSTQTPLFLTENDFKKFKKKTMNVQLNFIF